ncbi:MAG: hypothetical protein IKL11_05255, partial [Muribaculaceae bacterium]|nr:hypothetical protein [Muribaculaceae bacterium]
DAKSTIMTNAIKVFCKDLPQVKALILQEEEMQQMQQQAPMGGGEEVIADSAAVDTTNVKLQN